MSGSKSSSRSAAVKRDGSLRYATRHLVAEKGKRGNHKEVNSSKACDCLLKSEGSKVTKHIQNTKLPIKRGGNNRISNIKDSKNKSSSSNHQEKVVIVSKRSSSVSVVKSCKLRKSVSVKKVSYSTSVVLSSSEEDDSDSEDDDEESEEEEKEESLRKTRTVVKHTTSKVKSSFSNVKKSTKKSAQKAKAIKLLCEKLSSGKHKDELANRELRPRFPYSMLQDIPTARSHRMASLNALAKVHVLYENEGRTVGESLNDADETTLIDFLNDNSDEDDDNDDDEEEDEEEVKYNKVLRREAKSSSNHKESNNDKKSEKAKAVDEKQKNCRKNKTQPKPVQRRKRKRKAPDVEIIDTRICKRMASLNAQAILAASYFQEPKPKRISKKSEKCDSSSDTEDKELFLESKCDIEIIETENKEQSAIKFKEAKNNSIKQKPDRISVTSKENSLESKKSSKYSPSEFPGRSNWSIESDVALSETLSSKSTPLSVSNNTVVSSTSTKVGLTQYTEVTKVQINTHQDTEIKEESKSERKIEHIVSNDDVAITQMYHYQSKNANESYCVQMQTTYKPGSKTLTPPSLANPLHKHMSESMMTSGQNYYGGPSHSPIIPSQSYHTNPNIGPMSPVMGMDRVPRQYGGSAFTVPHYRQSQQPQYSQNEYGYYQPAGPLIQPAPDNCTIHKPVPYHPQPNLHQPPQRPQPPAPPRNSYQNFSSHQPHSNNSSVMSPHHPHRQKHIIPACPPPLEILPPQPKRPRYSLCRPGDEIPQRGYGSHSSYESSKHPRGLHTSYSSREGYSGYDKQKPTNAFVRYSQPYEQKDNHSKNNFSQSLAFNAPHQSVPTNSSRSSSQESVRVHENSSGHSSTEIHQHSSPPPGANHFKNLNEMVNSKERPWCVRDSQPRIPPSSSNFASYQEDVRKSFSVDSHESTAYPVRPPSVIEIVDDTPRDIKTYIQLEVPKNSHREKIVVVDVETDDIEQKHCESTNKEIILTVDETSKSLPEVENASIVKTESPVSAIQSPPASASTTELGKDKDSNETADITILEVKKKKESAVVRRARLHGKQRTFRDCYNRPLAPLSKTKKCEIVNITEEHLGKKFQPLVSLPRLVLPKIPDKKPIHGWSWEGPVQEKLVYVSNDSPPCLRPCYPAIRHVEGDVICVRDSVFLRSGPRKTDLPFVAKITALWENPTDGEMNMSLLWYYRPEHSDTGKKVTYAEDEIFASKHRDTNSVACIEDKCYVLTYAEYCRYKKRCRLLEDLTNVPVRVVPEGEESLRIKNLPPSNVSPDLVLFCRRVYDYRQKRLLKNPV